MDSVKINRDLRISQIVGLKISSEIRKNTFELNQIKFLREQNKASIMQMQKYIADYKQIGVSDLRSLKETRGFIQQLTHLKNSKLENNLELEQLSEKKITGIQILNSKAKLIQDKKDLTVIKLRSIIDYLKSE